MLATRRPSWLETELREQPTALERFFERELADLAERVSELDRADLHYLLIAARGSSDNAARYAQYLFGAHNRLPVALAAPSLYTRYRQPPRLDGGAVLAASQSGRSPDVVAVVEDARRQQRPSVALTNAPGSPLARAAAAVVDLHAGTERAVAATKTYTASLAAFAALSVELAADATRRAALRAVPAAVAATLEHAVGLEAPRWLVEAERCAVLARGYNYATAYEVALKIKELTGMVASPYSSADFLHGPIGAVESGFPVVLLAPRGVVFDDVAGLITPLQERGARILVVSDEQQLAADADAFVTLPAPLPEWLSPLTAVVPGQVLAWRLAQQRGVDVDAPHGLRKVTETH